MAAMLFSIIFAFSLPSPLIEIDKVYSFLNFCYPDYLDYSKVKFYDDYLLYGVRISGEVLTGMLILIFTILIIICLIRARRQSKSMGGTQQSRKARSSQDSQITNMLLTIVLMYFITKLPYMIVFMIYNAYHRNKISLSRVASNHLNLSSYILRAFSVLNHATNFLIYIYFVKSFRDRLFCQNRRGKTSSQSKIVSSASIHVSIVNSAKKGERDVRHIYNQQHGENSTTVGSLS